MWFEISTSCLLYHFGHSISPFGAFLEDLNSILVGKKYVQE
jgi:hypothetical protein